MNIYTVTVSLIEQQFFSLEENTNEIRINPITTSSIIYIRIFRNYKK